MPGLREKTKGGFFYKIFFEHLLKQGVNITRYFQIRQTWSSKSNVGKIRGSQKGTNHPCESCKAASSQNFCFAQIREIYYLYLQLYFFSYRAKPNSTPGHFIQKIGVNPIQSNRLNFNYINQFYQQFFLLKAVSKCEFKLVLKESDQSLNSVLFESRKNRAVIELVDRTDALFEFRRDIPLTSKQGQRRQIVFRMSCLHFQSVAAVNFRYSKWQGSKFLQIFEAQNQNFLIILWQNS